MVLTPPNTSDLRRHRRAIEASLCVDSLEFFFERAWAIVEPTRALLPSVAIDAFCAAGQAVGDGRIKRLGVETCPGTSKSLFWAVIFPAWLELRTRGQARVMAGSYAHTFAERDGTRCRDLVLSDWYRSMVEALGSPWSIREDANKKGDWWTSATGRRLITSVSGGTVGHRCTWQIIDDPLSEADVFSSANKAESVRWAFEVMPGRLEDQRVDPRVIVMQRLAADDALGEARKRGWPILSLPAVLGMWGVPDEGCVLLADDGSEIWRDPRAPGEPILELLDLPTLEAIRIEIGSATFAAKYLQRPGDDSAALFKRHYWNWYAPPGVSLTAQRPAGADTKRAARPMPAQFDRIVITADLIFGADDGDFAAVAAWGAVGPDRYLLRQRRGKGAGLEVSEDWLKDIADDYRGAALCIEKAALGWAALERLRKVLPAVKALKPRGKKKQRHAAAVPTVEAGNAWIPLGAVFEEVAPGGAVTLVDATAFIEEHAGATKNDDMADTTSYAIVELNGGGGRLESASADGGDAGTVIAALDPSDPEAAIAAALGG